MAAGRRGITLLGAVLAAAPSHHTTMGTAYYLCRHEFEVKPITLETARRLVTENHYARGGSNTAVYVHGLYRAGEFMEAWCQGAAWWIPPTRSAAEATYPINWQGVLSLSRLVCLPGLPVNAATFLLGRAMRQIDRARWPCLVTYADTRKSHTGAIYRATGWTYAGLTAPEATYEDANGRQIARKAGGHTRTHEEMLTLGYQFVGRFAKHKFVHVASQAQRREQRKAA